VIAGRAACLAVALAAAAPGGHIGGLTPGEAVTHAQNLVVDAFDGPRFSDISVTMTRWHELAGTYQGADVTGGRVSVRWATAQAYCVEGTSSTRGLEHLIGPSGDRLTGPCP
jgi:hypothetical protein